MAPYVHMQLTDMRSIRFEVPRCVLICAQWQTKRCRLAVQTAQETAEEAEERLCVICLVNDRDTTVLPCRHMCMCHECAQVGPRPLH